MYRKNIAVLFGGHSTEYDVSLQSAAAVLSHIPGDRYKVFSIGITRDGDWYHYTGAVSNIAEGRWCEEAACLHPVVFSQNRSVGGFLERHDGGYTEAGPCLSGASRQKRRGRHCAGPSGAGGPIRQHQQ